MQKKDICFVIFMIMVLISLPLSNKILSQVLEGKKSLMPLLIISYLQRIIHYFTWPYLAIRKLNLIGLSMVFSLKIVKGQNEFMRSLFLPKYQPKIIEISTLPSNKQVRKWEHYNIFLFFCTRGVWKTMLKSSQEILKLIFSLLSSCLKA